MGNYFVSDCFTAACRCRYDDEDYRSTRLGTGFADGKLLARLDRRRGEFTLQLPALKKGTCIDILVEAMGRVNFDESIHDRKGITEKVELVCDKQTTELKNWTVYNFPVDYSFVQDKKYKSGTAQTMPAYYKATFHLDKAGDTFLDMSTWGKGMVWVNGIAIGRFGRSVRNKHFLCPVVG